MQMLKERTFYFDALNVLSCISVVCLHSNGYIHKFDKDEWWWLRVLIEVICYFAVPVFFMLSGANLLNYRQRYSTFQFVRKRFLKVMVPFLCWGIIFYFIFFLYHPFNLKSILAGFTNGKIPYTSFWFFIPLFLLYFFMPFLSTMVNNLNKRSMLVLIVVLLLFQTIIPTLYSIMGQKFSMSLPIGGYFIYALLGYYIVTTDLEKNNVAYFAIGACALLTLIVRYVLIYNSIDKSPALFSYFGLYAVLPSVFIFISFKKMPPPGRSVKQTIAFLSKHSFGVYLIHAFLIFLLTFVITKKNPVFIPASIVLVYALSVFITFLMQRFKLTKFLMP